MRRTDPSDFTDEDNWSGGFYELEILLGHRDDARLEAAGAACWTFPDLTGPYPRNDIAPAEQHVARPELSLLPGSRHLYGIAHISGLSDVVCGCLAIRWEESEVDVLDFYLPVGALSHADERVGGFPFSPDNGPASLVWRRPIDDWLAQLGRHIYARVPFQRAFIGMEGRDESLEDDVSSHVPQERSAGLLVPRGAHLVYLPATE